MAEDTKSWTVEASAADSLHSHPDDAILVLRLGLALTAMRAAQRLTICVSGSDEPGAVRDRLWSFLLAAAYLHELRVTLQPRFPQVKALALQGGATEEDAKRVAEVISGKSEFSKKLDLVRNQLVFHFDEDAIREWIGKQKDDPIVWAYGLGPKTGNVHYSASTDAVVEAILSGQKPSTDDGRKAWIALVDELLETTELVTSFFEHAIAGYLNSVGATLRESE